MKAKPQAILLLAIPILLVLAPVSGCLFRSLKSDEIERNVGDQGTYSKNNASLEELRDKLENGRPLTYGTDSKSLLGMTKSYYESLQRDDREIKKVILDTDKHFEGYISGVRGEPYTTDNSNFPVLYSDAVTGWNGLNSLQKIITHTENGNEQQLFTDPRMSDKAALSQAFINIEPQTNLNDPDTKKIAQKKLWIQQRLLYTFLKPSRRDNTRALVMSLLENKGANAAIRIDIQVEKTNPPPKKNEPKKEYNIIYVYFNVVVDSRDLQQLIDEIQAYTPHNLADKSTIPLGIMDADGKNFKKFAQDLAADGENCNPILNLEFRVTHYSEEIDPDAAITRIKELETKQPIRAKEKRDEELKEISRELNRPVKVSFRVEMYDYITK